MLHQFLDSNRTELIARCRAKVMRRGALSPMPQEVDLGIPLFLGQLIETLRLEQTRGAPNFNAVGASREAASLVSSEIAQSAAKHGGALLRQGFTVDHVVRSYGDLCQSITELAGENDASVSPREFQTLNACLDSAIADAVTEFGSQRDRLIVAEGKRASSEEFGHLAHELRNYLNTAMLSFAAIKGGSVGFQGATSAVLERSLIGLRDLINRALADVRLIAGVPVHLDDVELNQLIADVQVSANLEAMAKGCHFSVSRVDPGLAVRADQQMLFSAVSNLLQNAFKFSRKHGHVTLHAYGTPERVLIEVADQCGGLPEGKVESMFEPFEQHHADRTGLGLGLSIARKGIEASGGRLSVRNKPGFGCVFTIEFPRRMALRAVG